MYIPIYEYMYTVIHIYFVIYMYTIIYVYMYKFWWEENPFIVVSNKKETTIITGCCLLFNTQVRHRTNIRLSFDALKQVLRGGQNKTAGHKTQAGRGVKLKLRWFEYAGVL